MDVSEYIFDAVTSGDAHTVRELVRREPSAANAYCEEGWTPLHLAAYYGQRKVAEVLLQSGANVQAWTRSGLKTMPIHAAAAGHWRDLIDLLISNGADVNARQHGGWTALHDAAFCGDVGIAKLLIEHGALINVRQDEGLTALGIAISRRQWKVVELLRSYGARE